MKLTSRRSPFQRCAEDLLGGVAAVLLVTSPLAGQMLQGIVGERLPSIPTASHINDQLTWIGSATTQGDAVMNTPLTRSTFGVNGAGIKIGVISDSYNFLGGQAAGIASGDLPGVGNPNGFVTPVNVLQDDLVPNRIDEGRAMAELIHDVAPGAQILFHSAFNNASSSPGGTIATAINNLVAAGADIIVDDTAIITMPAYQDGASAQAANAAFAAGVPYFSSAGNNSNNAYEGIFAPLGINHDFDANANDALADKTLFRIGSVPDNGTVRASLWWDDAYASLGGASTSDFNFGLFDITANTFVATGVQDQTAGDDAFEFVGAQNTSGATHQYGLVVQHFAGVVAKRFRIQVFGSNISDDDDTNSPTIFGHNSADGVVAVAAASVFNPNTNEPFSSHGPTTILFDAAGNPLGGPEVRNTPQITGPDGGNTTFFGTDVGSDADAFPNFFGTSAAAPHVAAVAALVMERAADLGLSLTPTQIYNILFNSTVDINAVGFDNITGWGRLDAFSAVSKLVPEPGTITLSLVAVTWFTGIFGRRRHEARA